MNKQLLTLKGFPASIINTKWEEKHLQSPAQLQRIATAIYDGGCTVFISSDAGIIIDRVLEDESTHITDMLCVDFPQYFADVMKDGLKPVKSKFLYINNINSELANSTTFSDKVLTNLIKTNKAAGNTTVIVSDMVAPSLFTRNYPLASNECDFKTTGERT